MWELSGWDASLLEGICEAKPTCGVLVFAACGERAIALTEDVECSRMHMEINGQC